MEKEEIGTKATRAATIQTLYNRKYLHGTDSLAISDLGFKVIEILTKYCPTIVSPELTRELEKKMNEIQQGKETKQAVLQDAIEILKPVIVVLKEQESVIGKQLDQTLKQAMLEERALGTCPKCADGKLVIICSKKTGKRFVGCTNYFKSKCNVTFPLPQIGTIKPLSKPCKICSCPTLYILVKGRRPWKLCLDPKCPSKRDRKHEMQNLL
jgi:DNA topoisomerase-1